MSGLDEVRAFLLRLSPEAACADCIVERLGLGGRQQVNRNMLELAGSGGFERRKASCSLCGLDKLVTRQR